jgi:uncharacterized damage-inducible protein DinB
MPWGRLGLVWPVASGTFERVGPNATRVEDDSEAVSRVLNARQVGEIEVAGPDLAASLTNLGLIDEYRLFLRPTVLARGSPFFAGSRPPLRLVTSDLAGESVIRLTYIAASSRDSPDRLRRRVRPALAQGNPRFRFISGFKLNLMNYDDLKLLIDYNYWARDRVLDAAANITPEQFIRPMGNSFNSVRDTVAHICAAERIWILRLKCEKPQGFQKPDRIPDVNAARKEWAELEGEMREELARLGPEAVERTIEYQDLGGNDQSDLLWQMLQHVVNHGTYHRGQITTMLRQLDAAPPKSMDLIAFYRGRNRKA